jgi:hypothetical protein
VTVAFEVLLGRFLLRLTWQELPAAYDIAMGGLMPLGLLILLFGPMIASKLLEKRS